MVAINFKAEFADKVEFGEKLQTIRRKLRCKKGDALQLYTGQRTPACRKLRDAIVIAVDTVIITPEKPIFGNPKWWPKDKDLFAENDGFSCYDAMRDFFTDHYGHDDFEGYIIMWSAK